MNNLLTGDDYTEMFNKEMQEIQNIDYTDDKNLSDEARAERDAAIEEMYGEGAYIEDGEVKDKAGNVLEEELTNEEIQNYIATSRATKGVAELVEVLPKATAEVQNAFNKNLKQSGMDTDVGSSAMGKILSGNTDFSLEEAELMKNFSDE
jgi:hypothetical protein